MKSISRLRQLGFLKALNHRVVFLGVSSLCLPFFASFFAACDDDAFYDGQSNLDGGKTGDATLADALVSDSTVKTTDSQVKSDVVTNPPDVIATDSTADATVDSNVEDAKAGDAQATDAKVEDAQAMDAKAEDAKVEDAKVEDATSSSDSGATSCMVDSVPVSGAEPPAPGDLYITEVLFNGENDPRNPGDETAREWFEVYNASRKILNLSGLTVVTSSAKTATITPSNVILRPGEYKVIANDPCNSKVPSSAIIGAYGPTKDVVLSNPMSPTSKAKLSIKNQTTDVVSLEYGKLTLSPPGEPGDQVSIQNGSTPVTAANPTWCASKSVWARGGYKADSPESKGTPGATNEACVTAAP